MRLSSSTASGGKRRFPLGARSGLIAQGGYEPVLSDRPILGARVAVRAQRALPVRGMALTAICHLGREVRGRARPDIQRHLPDTIRNPAPRGSPRRPVDAVFSFLPFAFSLPLHRWTCQMGHTRRILTSEFLESALGAAEGRAEGAAQALGEELSVVSPEFRTAIIAGRHLDTTRVMGHKQLREARSGGLSHTAHNR